MPETQSTALAVRTEVVTTAVSESIISGSLQGFLVPASQNLAKAGHWAGDTAQQFGTLLSDLLAPAVFTIYAFAAWSLASNLGWTDTFPFAAGPLANWIVWFGMALLLNISAVILKQRIQGSSPRS